jgi:hypothetical protein
MPASAVSAICKVLKILLEINALLKTRCLPQDSLPFLSEWLPPQDGYPPFQFHH